MNSTDRLEQWLRTLVAQSGADLFLVAGVAPAIRLNGVVMPLPEAPLEGDAIEAAVLPALHPHAVERYRNDGSAGCFVTPGRARAISCESPS